MRERDWLLSAIEQSPELEHWPRKATQEHRVTDLSEIIEATRKKIDKAFDKGPKIKGKYRM